jgi:3-hydroxyacyl-[acyl-carrier-protein] dehydratase
VDSQELRRLAKSASRRPLWAPVAGDSVSIRDGDIERLLPHRRPFLFVDAVTNISLTQQAICAERRIHPGDPVFEGHFPGRPVYPGVLQLEAAGQAGLCLLHFVKAGSISITPETRPADVRATKVHYAEFLAPVGPGDMLTILCRAVSIDDYTATYAGQILRGGTICSFGISEVYFVEE